MVLKTRKPTTLIIVVVGFILIGALTLLPRFLLPSPGSNSKSSPPDTSGWQTYQSDKFGFTIRHPQGWIVNDSKFSSSQEILVSAPKSAAIVKINAYFDKSISSEQAVREAVAKIKSQMDADPNITITNYQSDYKNDVGGHIISGSQVINNQNYQFENQGLISPNGRLLLFHGVAKVETANQYLKDITQIIKGFFLN